MMCDENYLPIKLYLKIITERLYSKSSRKIILLNSRDSEVLQKLCLNNVLLRFALDRRFNESVKLKIDVIERFNRIQINFHKFFVLEKTRMRKNSISKILSSATLSLSLDLIPTTSFQQSSKISNKNPLKHTKQN